MKKIHGRFVLLAACLAGGLTVSAAPVIAAPVVAAPPAKGPFVPPAMLAPVDPAKLAAAHEYLILSHPRLDAKSIAANIDKMIPRAVEVAKDDNPKLDTKKYAADTRARMLGLATARVDLQARIVASHFSLDELKALIAFQRSPVGMKLVAETPKIQREMMFSGRNIPRPNLFSLTNPNAKAPVAPAPVPAKK